ncbi:hypothetical protein [Shewanella waksmanii]|uniref:hypothetical protein n=1 Tax=Shewanella waksmanii TaxID=213783 RepID=UPI003736FA1D
MEESKLLSSASVFRAMYDEKKDIYDVLSEFIRAIISFKSLSIFNSLECASHIEEEFGFHIPEAIINSCLRNRLVKSGDLILQGGSYSVSEKFRLNINIESDFSSSRDEYLEIINRLYEYCSNKGLLSVDKNDLESDLEEYLIRPDKNNKHTNDIARYVVLHENEPGFTEKLNRIEEGLILYTGIKYSPDLSTLGVWRGNLTIFLDSEHLFSAAGLNGELYETLFNDFYSLIQEANRNKKGGRISLRYLEETDSEVDRFFYAAQKIVERKGTIDPSKTAMKNICNGCKYGSDVVTKKAEFLSRIKGLKIEPEDSVDYYSKPEFNVESEGVLASLESELSDRSVNRTLISSILKIFTKINYLRKGESSTGIDRVNSIFLTESWLPQRMAFSESVFEGNGAIPFATNIEFLTEKFWFKLNKGFGGKSKKPISFDPIIKAKLIISSQVSRSVSEIYRDLSDKLKSGDISRETVARIHHDIYQAPSLPEDVTIDSIAMTQDVLDENYIEKVIKEKSLLEKSATEGKQAIEELRSMKHQQKLNRYKPIKVTARRQYLILRVSTYIILPLLSIALLISMHSSSDSALSVVFGLASLISLVVSIVRPKRIDNYYWSLSKSWYRKSINKALQRTGR